MKNIFVVVEVKCWEDVILNSAFDSEESAIYHRDFLNEKNKEAKGYEAHVQTIELIGEGETK